MTPRRARALGQAELVALLVILVIAGQRWIRAEITSEAVQTWCTMFVAVVVQSTPFLVGGVLLSTVISRLVSERIIRRIVPRSPVLAVPVAGLAGICLPGCECAAVPVTDSLLRRGVGPGAAVTFLLAAPAINPTVIVSTAVAFRADQTMVVARVGASLATAVLVGWWCVLRGDRLRLERRVRAHDHHQSFLQAAHHDFLHAAGFLVFGAMAAAAVNTFVPREIMDSVAGHAVLGVLALATFAFVAALCSESDAFVAASLTSFSDTAKLAFLVVGPAMDVKLATMEAGQFGMAFARQFVPVVLVVALLCAVATGWLLL
ncbi:MAG: permease [Nocardioides sp.]|uniref:permease n=1 Tax=Nocardioides sp. TaxID=35761 RepID=UPI0039E297AD